ncbi:ThuA domain-containing protein [Dyadobacter sp. CY261]|uniref:ThuA domain-containing protein n=1 Tax=Dyadobacter sp. CY261 TaxID=2907203 RepID=UPI001F19E475|nr:ThuA domain-containing protein [Dyadobacter sp. CY261]MCF0069825.1 ThuA domain-containing protein [Dyadobacter sp. CY261]
MVFKILSVALIVLGASAGYALHLMRWLPWQKPVFERAIPANCLAATEKAVLVFSKTNGYRHASIEAGVKAIKEEGRKRGWEVVATENGAYFHEVCLKSYKAVVFLSPTGDFLTEEQQKAFEKYIENGGGYAGIHSASDCEYDWKWYGTLLGTRFRNHTFLPYPIPKAEIVTEPVSHAATEGLPARWSKKDEWYNFRENVRGKPGFQVLLTVDEATYPAFWPRAMRGDHPISWTRSISKGRMFYTAIGHNASTYNDPTSMKHIMGGIAWAGNL